MNGVADGLLATARKLAEANARRPSQSDLRRAVSTSYYAAFHALAEVCADRLIGTSAARSDRAWLQVYRAVDHHPTAQKVRDRAHQYGFPQTVCDFGHALYHLQQCRLDADYNPAARYTKADVLTLISEADQAIRDLRATENSDLSALAAFVLLRDRNR